MAGNVKAIGVQVNDPSRPKNLLIFSPTDIVKMTVKVTSKVRVKFFVHYLFFDLGQSW